MDDGIDWVDHRTRDGVVERSFRIMRVDHSVPGALWLPAAPALSLPVILFGHGGGGDKHSRRIVDLAHWFATHAGVAAVAIDGPYHGDRAVTPESGIDYHTRIADEGVEIVLDRMTDDWQATVNALAASDLVDAESLGYLGLSMGSRFGIPLVASLGDRFRCAVLGKFGLQQAPTLEPRLAVPERVVRDARRITTPVLFHIQWQDELFPRDGQLALFDALGSADKQLVAYTGGHGETKQAAVAQWRDFIVRHLTDGA